MIRPGHLDADYLEHMSADALRSSVYRLLQWANLGRPLGTGDCGGCGDFKMLYENPLGPVARCADCRRAQDERRPAPPAAPPEGVGLTSVRCDACGETGQGWVAQARGEPWGALPTGWMFRIDDAGSLLVACSVTCIADAAPESE